MEAKSCAQMGHIRSFFTRCLPIAFIAKRCSFMFLTVKFFSLNCSKVAVECDWDSKNSQNVQNLGFFGKIDGFFRKKIWKIFKIATCGKFFLQCASNRVVS